MTESKIWTVELQQIASEIEGGIPEILIKARLLQIAMKAQAASDALKAIDMLTKLGIDTKTPENANLTPQERLDAQRITAALLSSADPEIFAVLASWVGSPETIFGSDADGRSPDEIPALRKHGYAGIQMVDPQSDDGDSTTDGF